MVKFLACLPFSMVLSWGRFCWDAHSYTCVCFECLLVVNKFTVDFILFGNITIPILMLLWVISSSKAFNLQYLTFTYPFNSSVLVCVLVYAVSEEKKSCNDMAMIWYFIKVV